MPQTNVGIPHRTPFTPHGMHNHARRVCLHGKSTAALVLLHLDKMMNVLRAAPAIVAEEAGTQLRQKERHAPDRRWPSQ